MRGRDEKGNLLRINKTSAPGYVRDSDGAYRMRGDDGKYRLTYDEQRKQNIANAKSQSQSNSNNSRPNPAPQAAPARRRPTEPGAGTIVGGFLLGWFIVRFLTDEEFSSKATKVMAVAGLLFVVVIVGLGIYANRDALSRRWERRSNFTVAQEGDYSFDMRVVHNEDGMPWLSLAGTITNNTDHNWEFVSFGYIFTDANGQEHQAVRMATSNRPMTITVRNVPAGGSAEFATAPLPVNLSMDSIRATRVEHSNVNFQITNFAISLDQNLFSPGENITVTVHGNITWDVIRAGGFIAIFESGGGRRLEQQPLSVGDGIFNFTAPTAGGNYEIRLHSSRQHNNANISSVGFTVVPEPVPSRNSNFSISLDQYYFTPGETIEVTLRGSITQSIVRAGSFIAIYEAGTGFLERQAYHNLMYSGEISGIHEAPVSADQPRAPQESESLEVSEDYFTFIFIAPSSGGDYEIRLYYPNPRNANELVFIKTAFTVKP